VAANAGSVVHGDHGEAEGHGEQGAAQAKFQGHSCGHRLHGFRVIGMELPWPRESVWGYVVLNEKLEGLCWYRHPCVDLSY